MLAHRVRRHRLVDRGASGFIQARSCVPGMWGRHDEEGRNGVKSDLPLLLVSGDVHVLGRLSDPLVDDVDPNSPYRHEMSQRSPTLRPVSRVPFVPVLLASARLRRSATCTQ